MLISRIQNQILPESISLENALLELLEIAATVTTPESTGQVTTTYGDDLLTVSVSLPITQNSQPDGSVIISAVVGALPESTSN